MKAFCAAVCLGLLVSACGLQKKDSDDDGPSNAAANNEPTSPQSLGIQTINDLPECTEKNNTQLAYVLNEETFYNCSAGNWVTISIQGPKGDKGVAGSKGAKGDAATDRFAATSVLYEKYRRSITRIKLVCSCDEGNTTLLGSGFFCAQNTVCTNHHVATCPTSGSNQTNCSFSRMDIQTISASSDSVAPGGDSITPFFTTNSSTSTSHPSKDLAKIAVTAMPSGAAIIPLAAEPTTDIEDFSLTPILSMSFPLGMEDLYVDLGYVNNTSLDDTESKYKPGGVLDFSTSNDTDHGSSGSPLFNVETGDVIGVTTAGTEGENANYTWAIDSINYDDF